MSTDEKDKLIVDLYEAGRALYEASFKPMPDRIAAMANARGKWGLIKERIKLELNWND